MKRTIGIVALLAGLGGCVATETSSGLGNGGHIGCGSGFAATVPGVQGPWGTPVAMAAPYSAAKPGAQAAQAMLAQSVPLNLVQANGMSSSVVQANAAMPAGMPAGVVRAGGTAPGPMMPPGGVLTPPGLPGPPVAPGIVPPPGAVAAVGALTANVPSRFATRRTSVRFAAPAGMQVSWFGATSNGRFATNQLDVPGRYNFVQGAIYRLKLSNIPGHPGLDLYPTLEVVPSNAKTDAFLAHSAVPVSFTEEDFDQVAAGNYLVKVIYLPDPQFQDLAVMGADEVVSSRLEPGVDPIAEAYRRGSILLVVRMGNILLELPNTPSMDTPSPYQLKNAVPRGTPQMPPGMRGVGPMVPFNPGAGRAMMGANGAMMMPTQGPLAPTSPGQPFAPGVAPTLPGDAATPATKLEETPAIQDAQYQAAAPSALLQPQPVVDEARKADSKRPGLLGRFFGSK